MIFGRLIELVLESPDGKVKTFQSGFETQNDFHIEFTVEFGKGFTVKIYNVLRDTYLMCEKKTNYAKVDLYAGYKEGTSLALIASGDVLSASYFVKGIDRVLEIKSTAKVKSFYSTIKPETYYNLPIDVIIKQILLKSNITKYEINLKQNTVLNQYSSTGNLKNDLDKLCKLANVNHYISKGILYIEPEDFKRFKSGYIPLLDRESGLIGSPEQKGVNLHVRSLLNPEIDIGKTIQLVYRDNAKDAKVEAEYKVISGKHNADLGNQFYTEFECRKI